MLYPHPTLRPAAPVPPARIKALSAQYYPQLTDLGNALRFVEAFSQSLRYVPSQG